MNDREQHLEKKIDLLNAEAKTKLAKKDKKGKIKYHDTRYIILKSPWQHECPCCTGALFALKRRKLYEAELDKIANIKMTLETQVMNLESAQQNIETFKAMDAAKGAMADIRKVTDIDKVDDLMDGIKEEMELADEISNALAQPIDPLMQDEDDLLAELEELAVEDAETQLLQPATTASTIRKEEYPTVPSSALPTIMNATKEEEEELRQLEAELAGMWC
jgi:charged multivesicular body protein 4